ncbi:MAG: tetratricopeptide (TPR) repeat protein [Planctomycetota bacterium]|jgi:tetratricopeptide (TPR) repeat protein
MGTHWTAMRQHAELLNSCHCFERVHPHENMKSHPFALFALLLATLLGSGCMAARPIVLQVRKAPLYPIKGHDGVSAFPVEAREGLAYFDHQNLADKISGGMRHVLSIEGSGFKLIEGEAQDKIDDYLRKKNLNYDNISPDALGNWDEAFGNEIPSTGWFMARITVAATSEQPVAREAKIAEALLSGLFNPEANEEVQYQNVLRGKAVLGCEFRFLNLKTRAIQVKYVEKSIDATPSTAPDGYVPQPIQYGGSFLKAADAIVDEFSTYWTVTIQNVKVPIFVHDGTFEMPWEKEYPRLKAGFERMKNGDYEFAAEQYEMAVDAFKGMGGEMYARAQYNLAAAKEAMGDLDLALPLYKEAVRGSTNKAISLGFARCKAAIENRDKLDAIDAPKKPAKDPIP